MTTLNGVWRIAGETLGSLKERRIARQVSRAVGSVPLSRYLTGGFRSIEGWCGGPQTFLVLDLLTALQPNGCRPLGAAEIGVHHGLFFIGMHNLCQAGATSLALDLFDLQELNVDQSGCGDRERFVGNLAAHAQHSNNCIVHGGIDSLTITDDYAGELRQQYGPFRFVSIDGGHTADHCSKDMRTAEHLAAVGGIVIVDDSYSYEWPGVTEGMYRYLGLEDATLVPFAVTRKKAFFTQREFVDEYRSGLEAGLDRKAKSSWTKKTDILGSPVSVIAFN